MEVLRRSCGGLAEFFTSLAEVSCGAPQNLRKGLAELRKGLAEVSCGGLAEFFTGLAEVSCGAPQGSCGGLAEVLAEVLRSLLKPCGGLRKNLNFYITLS